MPLGESGDKKTPLDNMTTVAEGGKIDGTRKGAIYTHSRKIRERHENGSCTADERLGN